MYTMFAFLGLWQFLHFSSKQRIFTTFLCVVLLLVSLSSPDGPSFFSR